MAWPRKSSRSPTGRITTTPLSLRVHSLSGCLRGRPQHYSNLAITRVLMLKRIFSLILRAIQTIFTLIKVPLNCPDYTCISKQA
ncbi:MAG: hypothetical protein G5663_07330 [Serratia symbiotica]|nr:hypothetical protein [Serratia symbiotica]